jgi:SAM-dependent methyltransferase
VFIHNGEIYRQVNKCYQSAFFRLTGSGLYKTLQASGRLISHEEVLLFDLPKDEERLLVLKPEQLRHISYPAEWSFDQLKNAALLHLEIMSESIQHGLILKDATPYNVQFLRGAPLLIDSLSFDLYNEQIPWIAYRQFCETFLYPLLLEHYGKLFVNQCFGIASDGLSAQQTATLLPARSRYRLDCWLHVFLPARISSKSAGNRTPPAFSKTKMQQLVSHLTGFVRSLRSEKSSAAKWDSYYSNSILGQGYLETKTKIFETLLQHPAFDNLASLTVLDIGANNGHFSKLIAHRAMHVTAIDNDAPSINNLYNEVHRYRLAVLPLVVDISDPTASRGFANKAHMSFLGRLKSDVIIALAVVHHLAISRSIPLRLIAEFLSNHCHTLIIEYVPKDDPKVRELLAHRPDTFEKYNQQHFEEVFGACFTLLEKKDVAGTKRILYLYTINNSMP